MTIREIMNHQISFVCPFCKEERKKSCVYPGLITQTLPNRKIYYYNENGEIVINTENEESIIWTSTMYKCSRGHEWIEKRAFEEKFRWWEPGEGEKVK